MNKFNTYPEAWREISNQEFTEVLFCFQTECEYRQMFINGDFVQNMTIAILFTILTTKSGKYGEDGIGVAIFKDNGILKFAKFGSEQHWTDFNIYFSSQFKGDNS